MALALLLTGYAEEEQRKALHDPVLPKPFVPEQLAERIWETLVSRSNRPPRTDRM
jgi:hypothetical protein